jgi:hypothetical protein
MEAIKEGSSESSKLAAFRALNTVDDNDRYVWPVYLAIVLPVLRPHIYLSSVSTMHDRVSSCCGCSHYNV